jgi:RNA polymerase sigma-70 factor (family 1)
MKLNDVSGLSDKELLSLIRQSNSSAFREVFVRYHTLLIIYAHKKLQDKEASRDVIQDVFANIWQNRHYIEIKGSVASYLYMAVRNRVMNIFRDRQIDGRHLDTLQQMLESHVSTTDYRIREHDIRTLIEKEIDALPPKMKEVFELRRKQYLSNAEIAECLGLSEHTVATHFKRALQRLRIRLGLMCFLLCLIEIKFPSFFK